MEQLSARVGTAKSALRRQWAGTRQVDVSRLLLTLTGHVGIQPLASRRNVYGRSPFACETEKTFFI